MVGSESNVKHNMKNVALPAVIALGVVALGVAGIKWFKARKKKPTANTEKPMVEAEQSSVADENLHH